jgi:hypothetical protein
MKREDVTELPRVGKVDIDNDLGVDGGVVLVPGVLQLRQNA